MRIELLHFEGCPGFVETMSILEMVAAEEEITVEILPVALGCDDRLDFPGSPTILVDGEDLFPVKPHDYVHAVSCRIYATPEGSKNHPTAAMVRDALLKQ